MQHDLFSTNGSPEIISLGEQSALLRGYALPWERHLLKAIDTITSQAFWRRLQTPGGRAMSVQTTNSGSWGWHSDKQGYRYVGTDPLTEKPWPELPAEVIGLAKNAAAHVGFSEFIADACLINRYQPGTQMGLHQDRDEYSFEHPIVSVSLGLPARFLWGGLQRSDRPSRIELRHGDVVVWGGVDRLRYHGIAKVADGYHPQLGAQRINLTLRRAGP
ncbi:DNA oxidative demethylase AlkB [Pseudidiomarina terrestris]|uniref:DNA oxidative demethylase AlkB n=1 Tax=Pseudidiomarina terrestris TaxID=2820060 RepID=A0ABT8MK45_9GAMM|nr:MULTISPECIES: DNA oxidative demethylase AlkB [unclassified Pseudidiomarina]MDN7127534.1 DNA oxidative demethylase AlkB [Pseudidiomarina sp. 1APR75-33.1]MDN7130280.1 DNA oxidative demethylase AlkB [Pseudidiomarina sp. 1APR75-15]MDN7136203.1 DNA oxidative demethylase AlkB [Pseudidiomarina sp. 1ASP75-5]MEA3588657.1 DNA oxidative demethylase AlkB [Pseudidiomarina sp. 1APP75-27a]